MNNNSVVAFKSISHKLQERTVINDEIIRKVNELKTISNYEDKITQEEIKKKHQANLIENKIEVFKNKNINYYLNDEFRKKMVLMYFQAIKFNLLDIKKVFNKIEGNDIENIITLIYQENSCEYNIFKNKSKKNILQLFNEYNYLEELNKMSALESKLLYKIIINNFSSVKTIEEVLSITINSVFYINISMTGSVLFKADIFLPALIDKEYAQKYADLIQECTRLYQ